MAASARVDGSGGRRQAVAERLALLIIDDAALRLEDLTARDEDGALLVVPAERIEAHLSARYRGVTSFRDSKREYLCQLYGRFRGQKAVSFAEAESAVAQAVPLETLRVKSSPPARPISAWPVQPDWKRRLAVSEAPALLTLT